MGLAPWCTTCSSLAADRDMAADLLRQVRADRDRLAAECERLNSALAAATDEASYETKRRDDALADRARLAAENAHIKRDRDECADQRDAANHDRDRLAAERDEWKAIAEKAVELRPADGHNCGDCRFMVYDYGTYPCASCLRGEPRVDKWQQATVAQLVNRQRMTQAFVDSSALVAGKAVK